MQFQRANLDKYNNYRGNSRYNQENPQDSGQGEMAYTEPNVSQIQSSTKKSREKYDQNDQNNIPPKVQSFQTFGKNTKKRSYKPKLEQSIPSRYDDENYADRSKNEINVDSSRDDYEYRMPSLNPRRNNNYNNMNNDGNQYDDEYQEYQNESEIPRTEIYSRERSPQLAQRYQRNSPSRQYKGAVPLNQVSPRQNFEEFNTSTEKINDQPSQTYTNPTQSLNNSRVLNKDKVSHKYNDRTHNNVSYKDVKKIANRFSKLYDPYRNNDGLLLEESQVTVPGAQDEVFNNRYKVLSKMNRLSNILLARKNNRNNPEKKDNTFNTRTYNRNSSYNNIKKPFGRSYLDRSVEKPISRKTFSRSPNHKFLYVSLAMISSKTQAEDKPILSWMRLEKGGVVDLAHDDNKRNNFKIRKAIPKKGIRKKLNTNPRQREKAAKTIQNWWRDLKSIYNDRMNKIIKIQSAFRGKFVRKYMYDLLYLNFLYISFCRKIEDVLGKHVRPYVWDKLFKEPEKQEKEKKVIEQKRTLTKIVTRDYRNDLKSLLPAWKKWLSQIRRKNMHNYRGRNLIQIRSDKENKYGELRNAFNKWKYLNKVLDAEDKLAENEKYNKMRDLDRDRQSENDREKNIRKLYGLFKLNNGIDNYVKKEAMNHSLPKIENYLRNQGGKGRLKQIIIKKPNNDKDLLKKNFYKWLAKSINESKNDIIDKKKREMDEFKDKIIRNTVAKILTDQKKNLLKKYLYRWLKKSILLAIKEERDKAKNNEKLYKDKEYEIIEEYEKKIVIYETKKKEDDEEGRRIKTTLDKLIKESNEKEEELRRQLEAAKDNKDKNLLNYLKGTEILQRAVWRKTHPDPLRAIGEKVDEDNIVNYLRKLSKIKKKCQNEILRNYLNRWRKNALKGVNKKSLYILLAKFMTITSNNFKNKLLEKKFNKWRRAAKVNPYDSLKKAKNIYDFGDLIRKIFVRHLGGEFLDKLGATKNPERYKRTLTKIVKRKYIDNKDELRKAFDKWRKVVQKENVKKLKCKIIYKIYNKNKSRNLKDILNKYFQIWKNKAFKDNLRKYKNDIRQVRYEHRKTKRVFVKSIVTGLDKRANKDLLREYFNRWRRLMELEKNENYKRNKKRIMLAKIIEKKSSNNYLTLLQYLLKWKNKMYELKVADVHLPYRRAIIKILLTKNDKEKLQKCFLKWKYGRLKQIPIMPYIVAKRFLKKVLCRRAFNEFVKKMNERNPKVLRMKGKQLIKTLKDIKDNRIRDFLLKLIRFIRIRYLRKIQPKVDDTLKKYYLRKYFNRWVDNTLGYIEKRKEIITQYLKTKLTENKVKKTLRIKEILRKYVKRQINNKKRLLEYGLLKYYKNTKLDIQLENAKIIQDFCREQLDKIIKIRLQKRKELADLLNKLYRKKFFNDLRDLANQASPLLKENRRRIKTRVTILRKVVTTSDTIKNLDFLKEYWNRWKRNKGLLEKYALIIQTKYRKYLSVKILRSLRRLNEVLLKIILLNKDKEKEILASRLHQWRKNARLIECEENAKIIQDFCRTNLNNYLKNKLSNYLYELAKKYTRYLINNMAKLDKLNKALRHRPLKDGMNAIKNRTLYNIIKLLLIRVISKRDDLNRRVLLRYYLEQWYKKAYKLKNLEDDMASRIQAIYKGYNYRKWYYMEETRITTIRILIEKLISSSSPKNILHSALAKWRKNVGKIICDENARIIQNFCREILQKVQNEKNRKIKDNYLYLAKIINKLRESPEDFFERLKIIRKMKVLEELLNELAKKRRNTLKNVFDLIKRYPRFKYLLITMIIREDLKYRLLKKYLNNWRNKAMRYKGIMQFLRSVFYKNDDFNNNLLKYNLRKWQYKARYLTQKENANIISDFCKDILKKNSVIRNWHKLSNRLRNKDKTLEIDELLYRLRILIGLYKLKEIVRDRANKTAFYNLSKIETIKTFKIKITSIFYRQYNYWKENLLREYINIWRNNAFLLRNRNRSLKDVMSILDQLRIRNAADAIANASIIKKFEHDYPLIRAIGFFDKLKQFSQNRNLGRDLVNAKRDLEPKKRANLINKLYKVYAYKVFNKLFDDLKNAQKRNAITSKELFIYLLRQNNNRYAERKYVDQRYNEVYPKNTQSSFRLKKPKTIKDDQKKRLIYVSLLPSLIDYLKRIILVKNKDAFDAIRRKSNAYKFCELYKRWTEKQELDDKKELVELLKRIYNYQESEGPLLIKLFKLLRRESIKRIFRKAAKVRKVMGMIYTTRLLIMQRELAKEKFLRQLIRRWRYITFSKKLALNKMKSIYKTLHVTYLEMANNLFGENKDEPSVVKEFERFGTSVGMWQNEKPDEKVEEKYVKAIKTKYVFDAEDFRKFQEKYYPNEEEVEEEFEGEVEEEGEGVGEGEGEGEGEEEYYEEEKKVETEKKIYYMESKK